MCYLFQVTNKPVRTGALLSCILTNKEGLICDVKVKGCPDIDMVKFWILRAWRKTKNKLTALKFRRAVWPFQICAWRR